MPKVSLSKEITDNIVWPLKLRSYLQGMEDIPESNILSEKCCCYLGKWLSKEGLTHFGDIQEVKELEKIHLEFHESLSRLVHMKNEGTISLAKQELKIIDPISKRIIHLLTTVERKIY
ncbi:MAG: CZB domain-containing protein [Candidatus Aureabacteria bacterium]|nr:CZB domain-containing protein [Candidatus Auribacterota bacterium]